MFVVFAVKIVVKHKSVVMCSFAIRASVIVAHTARLQKQRVPKGGYEELCSLVFLGVPSVASQAVSCSPMFVVVRSLLLVFLSTFLSGFIVFGIYTNLA